MCVITAERAKNVTKIQFWSFWVTNGTRFSGILHVLNQFLRLVRFSINYTKLVLANLRFDDLQKKNNRNILFSRLSNISVG